MLSLVYYAYRVLKLGTILNSMARLLKREHHFWLKSYYSACGMASESALKSSYASELTVRKICMLEKSNHHLCKFAPSKHFSVYLTTPKLCWEGSSRAILLAKFETYLTNHQLDEAWETFKDFKRLYGFPEYSILNRLIMELLYSTDSRWLQKAYDLAPLVSKEKSVVLGVDLLTKLCLSLSRAEMPIQASWIVRMMLQKRSLPTMDILGSVVLHMVKTETGAILASNILIEICDLIQQLNANKSNYPKLIKPDTMIFNLVLKACVRFGSSLKGLQIIEVMAHLGVVADAHTINIISLIHEKNHMRDELKKFKEHIDLVSSPLVCHYRQFFDSLLSLHFIFNDIDAASALILDMFSCSKTKLVQEGRNAISIGSSHIRMGLKLHILPGLLQKDSVLRVDENQNLVISKNGKLVLSKKALSKLIILYRRQGRINELSMFLSRILSMPGSSESDNLCSDVIGACIHLGWLETAHDILDDLGSDWNPDYINSYMSLMTAYYHKHMNKEGNALFEQLRKAGLLNSSMNSILDIEKSSSEDRSELVKYIIQDMDEEGEFSSVINELNSSIYFFMKAKMVEDALKAYRKIQDLKLRPTLGTFANLVNGYSSLGMYREITILWGDIKRSMEHGKTMVHRDLYETLLLNFIRGGYFERAMEVIAFMMEKGFYMDKWIYKNEFLKFHKDLYRKLKASNARNEVQAQRLEHVLAFRKWVGIK